MQKYQTFINGKWVDAAGGQVFETVNPYTTLPWALIPRCGSMDVDAAVRAARMAFEKGEWADMPVSRRGALLRRLGDLITSNAEHLATIETTDNGRLLTEARQQVTHLPQWFHYFAGMADKMDGSVPQLNKRDLLAFTRYEPLGVIAAFTPWNSPLLLLTWKLAVILAAGNTVVVKPSEFASASTLEFMRLVEQAGFPPGVINVVTGFGNEVGEALVSHPDIAKITFTGGEIAATKIAAATARNLTPALFELGGKSANIVFADAKLENAVKAVSSGIYSSCGQACAAGSRAVVARSVYDEFVERLVHYAGKVRIGDPMNTASQLGPIGTQPQHQRVLSYFDIGRNEGAEIALGGKMPDPSVVGPGWFVEPTVFRGVSNKMRIAQEEIFGPILSVIPFDDDDEALAIANDIPFGLAGGVWSSDIRRAMHAAEKLKAGTVWINTYRAFGAMVPFGGMKRSGHGRENGRWALEEFMQSKSYWLSYADSEPAPFLMS